MKLHSDSYSLSALVSAVKNYEIGLPEFQREFVWRPNQIADLLLSVARGWPIGSFLLLEMDPQDPILEPRPLEPAPGRSQRG